MKEVCSEDLSARAIHFNEFLDILLEPKFQVLESEYQMSRRLTLVCIFVLIFYEEVENINITAESLNI